MVHKSSAHKKKRDHSRKLCETRFTKYYLSTLTLFCTVFWQFGHHSLTWSSQHRAKNKVPWSKKTLVADVWSSLWIWKVLVACIYFFYFFQCNISCFTRLKGPNTKFFCKSSPPIFFKGNTALFPSTPLTVAQISKLVAFAHLESQLKNVLFVVLLSK